MMHDGGAAPFRGGCQCGRVRYAFTGKPTWVGVCSCAMCRRANGAPLSAFVSIKLADFNWQGIERPEQYNSSSAATRYFCKECGTPVALIYTDDDEISVTWGTLDDADSFVPNLQIGAESRPGWLLTLSDLVEHPTITGLPAHLRDKPMTVFQYRHDQAPGDKND